MSPSSVSLPAMTPSDHYNKPSIAAREPFLPSDVKLISGDCVIGMPSRHDVECTGCALTAVCACSDASPRSNRRGPPTQDTYQERRSGGHDGDPPIKSGHGGAPSSRTTHCKTPAQRVQTRVIGYVQSRRSYQRGGIGPGWGTKEVFRPRVCRIYR